MGVYEYACTCVSNVRGHSYYVCETQTFEYGTCWVVMQSAYSCSSIPLREIHKEKKVLLMNSCYEIKKKKMFCKYVCLSVNVYVCMNVSCCWKCAAEFFHGVRLEKHLKKERKKIKHFAASLLRHLHQRNTNGYNTQTTPRFGRK